MKVKVSELSPSKFSESIYSPEPDQPLIDSIESNGVIQPIFITSGNTIIAGHRRVNACKQYKKPYLKIHSKPNTDNSSRFMGFSIDSFKENIILKEFKRRQHEINTNATLRQVRC